MKALALILTLCAAPAFAQSCPAVADITKAQDRLFDLIAKADNHQSAKAANDGLWELWLVAPDAKAQTLLDQGLERRRLGDFGTAFESFDELIAYCPDYAEGYNQRAFTHYLSRDFDSALPDLDRALALSPRHLGAMTGKALTLIGMGRAQAAQPILREAVDLNPWLSERALLIEPDGTDL